MPLRNGYTYTYPLPTGGVNLFLDLLSINRDESPRMENCFYRNGIIGRKGMKKLSTKEVNTGNEIMGLHSFNYGISNKQLIVKSGTAIKWYDESSDNWETIEDGLPSENLASMYTWGPKNAVFVANGKTTPFKWVGNNKTYITAAPAKTKQFLPMLDRMLSIDNSDVSFIRWSKPYDDSAWETAQNSAKVPGPGKIEGMSHHGLQSQTGFTMKTLFFKNNSIWLFSADDLTPASLDVRLDILSPTIGSQSIRTVQNTTIGSIFLGADKQVYLITIDSQIIPIGGKIRSNISAIEGIESIPTAHLSKCFAVVHDGFYKLFVVSSNSTIVNIQYWLDINRFGKDQHGLYGPWYGPMTGQNIAFAIVDNNGNLFGGEGDKSKGSYIYKMDETNADDDQNIRYLYVSNFDAHQRSELYKTINRVNIEMGSIDGSLTISLLDTGRNSKSDTSTTLIPSRIYFNDKYFNEFYFSSKNDPMRFQVIPDKALARYLAVRLDYSSKSEIFNIHSVAVEGQLRGRKPFIGQVERV